MSTVFVGGSRNVSHLPPEVAERLNNVMASRFPVLVGDANGMDKAVQRHLTDARYKSVTVFCSGASCRNNLGQWNTTNVTPPAKAKGFQVHATKDREMARLADFGLMIWDGKSPGTALNVLRLVRLGKKAVLFNVAKGTAQTFKSETDWDDFLSHCSPELRHDLQMRATPDEWQPSRNRHPDLLDLRPAKERQPAAFQSDAELTSQINAALASGDPKTFVDLLGHIAKDRGMSQVAKDTGLAREGLYRALSSEGNPEFATVLKVASSVGIRLSAQRYR
jgi:probable addiction module antidote protein